MSGKSDREISGELENGRKKLEILTHSRRHEIIKLKVIDGHLKEVVGKGRGWMERKKKGEKKKKKKQVCVFIFIEKLVGRKRERVKRNRGLKY